MGRHDRPGAGGAPGTGASLAEQARARGVRNERVLAAIAAVPRENFMPENNREFACTDEAFPIGEGQTISQPTLVARMTELLDPEPEDAVLEVGAGSGYQAALLSKLVRRVFAVEIRPGLAQAAAERLARHGFDNVTVKVGDGYDGWREGGPYDGIIISCAADQVPEPLIEQLKEGGRMVLPLGNPFWGQRLTLLRKSAGGKLQSEQFMSVKFVPLTGPHGAGT